MGQFEHLISTRLTPIERDELTNRLRSPQGGWFQQSTFARWMLQQNTEGRITTLRINTASVEAALIRFRGFGRSLNLVAFAMNSTRRHPSPQTFSILEKRWGAAFKDLAAAIKIDTLAFDLPKASATPPVIVREAPSTEQKNIGQRERTIVFSVRLSGDDMARVRLAAQSEGLDPADFLRSRILSVPPLKRQRLSRPAAKVLALVLEEAGRQANNWRQLRRSYRRDAPPLLDRGLADIASLRNSIVPHLRIWQ